jgi:hypothetical protein
VALGYNDLTEPERAVWDAIADGALVELPVTAPAAHDPADGATWGEDRWVRAQLLCELLTERTGPKDIRPRAIKLAGARITGVLDLEAATLACPLTLCGCSFEQSISLYEAQAIAVRLPGCDLLGFNAQQLTTRGNLELDGLIAAGVVNLIGARIGGSLNFEEARLINSGETALRAEGVKVERNVICDGAEVQGQIDLLGATVGGRLSFNGAKLVVNPGETVLNANRLTVEQSIYCRRQFEAQGEINLIGARIGGSLSFEEARLINPGETALRANKVRIARNLICDAAAVQGQIDLAGANIGGTLSFAEAKFVKPGRTSVDLTGALVTQSVEMRPESIDGALDLTAARVGRWHDDRKTWKQRPLNIELSGFEYQTIDGKDAEGQYNITLEDRLKFWLPTGARYSPQPYEQLAAVYRREGNEDARTVAIGKQRARRDAVQGRARPLSKAWSALLYWTIGYGYQPAKALIPLAGLLVAGTVIFGYAYPDQLHPAKKGTEQPGFNPFRYTLDLLLPIANFKQRDAFVATGWIAWLSFGFTFAGWLLGVVVVAGLGGVFKRD